VSAVGTAPSSTGVRPPGPDRAGAVRLLGAMLVVVALGAVAGSLGEALRPPTATARTVVALAVADDSRSAERAGRTQLAIVLGRGVLEPVASRMQVPVEELERTVEATLLDPALLRIEARGTTDEAALWTVAAVTDEYLMTGYTADVRAGGLVRAHLVSVPHVPVEPDGGPGRGAGLGAAAGLVVAALAGGLQVRRWRSG
jgi:hypothetical protein